MVPLANEQPGEWEFQARAVKRGVEIGPTGPDDVGYDSLARLKIRNRSRLMDFAARRALLSSRGRADITASSRPARIGDIGYDD
jgi:hypothetical protein